ncbi:hypothetical protein KY385_02420 [Candidatus Parcubacteria bacterium]|nr:hypothetical protein [Candidatus Parcubacteria bacterium]
MRLKFIVRWILLAIILGGTYLVFSNAQNIMDWYALRNYEPPKRIVQLADDTTMKPDLRRIFYVNHPQLNDKVEFNQNCRKTEQSIVLGCYVENQGIYLLEVEDKRLQGVVEVTAAHEVLHAVYDRLNSKERDRVDKMTASFFKQIKDERINKTVENYRTDDSSIVANELHSILATEVMDLPAELEEYYGQYFNDRKRVVSYSGQYEQAFIKLRNQVDRLDEQLQSLKNQIEASQVEIEQRNAEIEQRRRELDRMLADNEVEQYNAQVANFNALVGSYNRLINSTKQKVNYYNQLVQERNSLATAEQELVDAIDSNIIPGEKSR